MNIQRISSRGLLGLQLFPDAVAFDFSTLPEGVVAITGPIGHGKTTLLELPIAALYGKFPSRPDNKLFDSVTGRDAYLEVELDVAARGTYRARVNVDAVSRATDALLERTDLDGTRHRLNDGKISTFQEAIARELPSLTLVLASAFAAQGREGSFAQLGRQDRRKLFAELLGLETYGRYAETAKAAAVQIERHLAATRAVIARLKEQAGADRIATLEQLVTQLDREVRFVAAAEERAGVDYTTAQAEVDRWRAELERRTADAQGLVALRARAEEAGAEGLRIVGEQEALSVARNEDVERLERAHDRAVAATRAAIANLKTVAELEAERDEQVGAIATGLANKRALREKRIANNEALLARAEDISIAVTRHVAAVQRRNILEVDVEDGRQTVLKRERALETAQQHLAAAGDVAGQLARAQADAALIDTVPFGEQCATRGCQFVQGAAESRDRIPALERAVAHKTGLAAVAAQCTTDLADARRDMQERIAAMQDLATTIHTLEPEVALRPTLEAAVARLAEVRAELQEITDEAVAATMAVNRQHEAAIENRAVHAAALDADLARLQADWLAEEDATCGRWEIRASDLIARAAAAAETLADLRRQIDTLEDTERLRRTAAGELEGAEARAQHALTVRHQSAADRASLTERLDASLRRLEELHRDVAERERLEALGAGFATELVEWQALAAIFGPTGLPVIEIDAAGPSVSAIANDLLQACFGSRFVVDLVTQDTKADGRGMKEVFELKVWDNERAGKDRDLADLSGGERVIVEEALKSAIALYLNQRNICPISTCWRDETVGGLDPDSALLYVAMLRRVRERGGFTRVLFISHNLEAAAQADAQIRVQDGTIRVLYPPFTEAA